MPEPILMKKKPFIDDMPKARKVELWGMDQPKGEI